MENTKESAARVGFVVFLATIIFVVAVYLIEGGLFQDTVQYYTKFPSASGLRPDARVFLSGLEAGSVNDVSFPENLSERYVRVSMRINKKFAQRIRKDSYAWIQNEGLVGDYVVSIQMGDPSQPHLPPGSVIEGKDKSLIADLLGPELMSGTNELLAHLIKLLQEVNAGNGTVGQLLMNPGLYNHLNEFTASMATTSNELADVTRDLKGMIQEIRAQKGTLGKLLFSEEYARDFARAIKSSSDLMESLNRVVGPVGEGKGSLGMLITDEKLKEEIRDSVSKLHSLAASLTGSLGNLENKQSALARFLNDPEMGRNVNHLIANLEAGTRQLDELLEKINTGQGSLGMLVNDPSIAGGLRDLVQGVREQGLLMNLVHRAEEQGRQVRGISFRDDRLMDRLARKEIENVEEVASSRSRPEKGTPVPASGKEGEGEPSTPKGDKPQGDQK